MPRRALIRQKQFPYHVTTRTNNKDWFQIPIFEVWDCCKEALLYANQKKPVIIHCFMLMSNHYHLLLTTPDENIDDFMQAFNLCLSRLISKKSGVINHKFSNRYKWTIVSDKNYLLNVYRYIYQNPVRAKMTKDTSRYPSSSLHFTNYESSKFNYRPHFHFSKERSWLERKVGGEFNQIIKKALKKEIFRPNNKISTYHSEILNNPKF